MHEVVVGSLKGPSTEDLQRLSTLSAVFHRLSQTSSNNELADVVLEVVLRAFGADRGFIKVFPGEAGQSESTAFLDRSGEEPTRASFTYTSTWLENCLASRSPLVVIDTEQVAPTQSVTMTGIRSVMLTPLILNQRLLGVIYLDSILRAACFEENDLKLFSIIGEMVAVAIDRNHKAATVLKQSQALDIAEAELEQAAEETIRRLSKAAEFRDGETSEHLTRVSEYCEALSRQLGLDESQVSAIKIASLLHDVGKLGIPDSIMLKPGRFTDYERKVMQQHTIFGARILADSPNPVMELAASIALRHHEKWDGSGYPYGLSGEDIPLPARIVAIADVFDAVSSARRYKESYSLADSFSLLQKESGSHFDPNVVAAFLALRPTIERIWTENQEEKQDDSNGEKVAKAPENAEQALELLRKANAQLAGLEGELHRTDRQAWIAAVDFLSLKLEAESESTIEALRSLLVDAGLDGSQAFVFQRLVERLSTYGPRQSDTLESGVSLMIVDTDPYQREVLSTEATRRGLAVLEVGDAAQARLQMEKSSPDLTLLELADVGASEFAEWLMSEHPDHPLMILTRDGDLSRRLLVCDHPNCAFLHKPLPPAAVIDEAEERLPGGDEDLTLNVLALDDDPVVLKVVDRVLGRYGYHCLRASNPEEFWAQLVEHTPDLILLDLEMPTVSGFEVCRLLRSDVKYRHLPVIVLTSHQELSEYQKALEAGADDVLSKPLQPSRLLSRIESRLARNRALQLSAGRDPLTGLIHRRQALRTGEQMFASAVSQSRPFSVCRLEIEAFDNLVEEKGWQQAASLLRQVAEVLVRSSRPEDVVSRSGEHSLLMFLTGLDADSVAQRVASLNSKLQQHKGALGTLKCVGKIASFPKGGNELKSLLRQVDSSR